ncbi:MAG: hypothetical protein WCM76_06820 [Bacteroidota bacterium]
MEKTMSEKDLQQQISELNQKVDLLLEYVNEQRQKREVVDDLITDVSIIGKDVFKSVVEELDQRGCELDTLAIKELLFKLLRNVNNISQVLDMFESTVDLVKDAAPIAREMIIDFIHKLHEYETKGYFEYMAELYHMIGEMHKHYTVDDLKALSSNMPSLFSLVRLLNDKSLMQSLEKVSGVLTSTKIDETIDNKSLYKIYKELKSPEVRKALSYTLRVIKESAK